MTRNDIKDALIVRLGQRSDLSSAIDSEIQFAQVWLENRPFLPWFLQADGSSFNINAAVDMYELPEDFIREVDIAGMKGSLLIADAESGGIVAGTYVEARKYDPGVLDVRYINEEPGKPAGYAISGTRVRIAPVPDSEYYGLWRTYYKKAAKLTSSLSTNVWTMNSPDSLVAATGLRMSLGFLKSEKVYAEFRAFFDEVESALMKSDVARQEAGIVRLLGETC